MTQQADKREYHKPTVLKIDLSAEEVLAVGCKVSAPSANRNGNPCLARACSQQGS